MKVKRIGSLFLVLILLVVTACSSGNQGKETKPPSSPPIKESAVPTPDATETPTEVEKPIALKDLPSLKEIYKDDFLMGTIYAETNLGEKDIELMDTQFTVITPENILKPESMQAVEGTFTYGSTDKMMDFAKEHNFSVVAHTLVWHQQIPTWMTPDVDKETAIAQMKNHILNVAGYYKGQFISWDVVNEAIEDGLVLPADGDWTKCLRKSKWYNSIGPEYLAMAFRFAREADPDCKLYYNDYNLETPEKADVAYAMLKDLISQGVPIDGVGLQAHYQTGTAAGGLEYAIEKFSSLGLEISITELDVTYSKTVNGEMPKEGEIQQALTYAQIFKVLKKFSDKIHRVTFWGNIDSQSWRSEMFPCLFDADYQPKEAFYAVVDPEGYLEKHADLLGVSNAENGTATYGSPTIDGEEEDLWSKADTLNINKQLTAWQGATGEMKVMWDEKNLYVLVHVKDEELNSSAGGAHEKDSVEIFLDQKNDKKGSYGDDDGQYRINYKGQITYGTVPTKEGVEGIAKEEAGGYIVEMKIPFTLPMKEGTVVGFDAQINDAKAGARQGIAKFSDTTNNSYLSTEYYGNLTLKK